tara:strand:- start:183 stop:794 length:612 start_codon:yes stop_codon:yes gene_type:complete
MTENNEEVQMKNNNEDLKTKTENDIETKDLKKVNFLEKENKELKEKLKDLENKILRALAENENLRKRHEKEIQDNLKFSIKNFAYSLLGVADNFQRAMQSIPENTQAENQLMKNLLIGMKAIEKEFYDAFEKNGIKKYTSIGKKFDPEFHQAVSNVNSEIQEGFIVDELQPGFMIDKRLLRPSMVTVSVGKKESKDKETKEKK